MSHRNDPHESGMKHTFTHRVVWCLEDARTRNSGDVNSLLLALLREFLPSSLFLVLLLGLLRPNFQFLLVLLFLPFPLLIFDFRHLSFVIGR